MTRSAIRWASARSSPALPLITLFVLLGGFRVTAWIAGLVALGVALLVSILVYDVPVGQALDMGLEGAAFGLFPILWIVINAIWIYNMTGQDGALRRAAALVRDDLGRPAHPGGDHRLLLRRADRGPGRVRHAGRDHRGDAAGAGLHSR